MTCVVGLAHEGRVYVGGDSAGVDPSMSCDVFEDPKVFVLGRGREFVLGMVGSFRAGQVVHYGFRPPKRRPRMSDQEYLCTDFVDALRERFKASGVLARSKGEDEGVDESLSQFILGYRGGVYVIDFDFQVARSRRGYVACGCGEDVALGVLYALNGSDLPPEERIQKALEAAVEFSAGVRPPFAIASV